MPTPKIHTEPAPAAAHKRSQPIRCPAFTAAVLQRQLIVDAALRWGMALALVVCVVWCSVLAPQSSIWSVLPILGFFTAWFALSTVSARVVQQIPHITALIEHDTETADAQLAQAISRKPVPQSVRLLLYHRLAMLRQRQKRYDEVAVICQAVLEKNLGAGLDHAAVSGPSDSWGVFDHKRKPGTKTQTQSHLLLMLVEAHLHRKDLFGAYTALYHLHRCRLGLVDMLQLLVLQTRYEILAGYNQTALDRIDQKIGLAELMPAAQCRLMHILLAIAAAQAEQAALSQWLTRRVELLCTPHERQVLARAIEVHANAERGFALDSPTAYVGR